MGKAVALSPDLEKAIEDGKPPVDLGGRPRKELNEQLLRVMVTYQATAQECAAAQDMSVSTLHERLVEMGYSGFRDYFAQHKALGLLRLRTAQFKKAMAGDSSMLIHLGKVYAGQNYTDQVVLDANIVVEGEISVDVDVDFRQAVLGAIHGKAKKA